MTTHGTRHGKDMEFIEMHPKISDNGDRFDMSDVCLILSAIHMNIINELQSARVSYKLKQQKGVGLPV